MALQKCLKVRLSSTPICFQEVFNSKEWQDFCTSDGLTCDTMIKGTNLSKFHADQYAAHEKLIAQVGASAITGE